MSKEENESFPPFLFSDIVGVSLSKYDVDVGIPASKICPVIFSKCILPLCNASSCGKCRRYSLQNCGE